MLREIARWEQHKDAAYCFEQILEAAPHKTAINIPSHKPAKSDKQNILGTTGNLKANSVRYIIEYILLVTCPKKQEKMAQGRDFRGSRHRVLAQSCLARAKIPPAPSTFP